MIDPAYYGKGKTESTSWSLLREALEEMRVAWEQKQAERREKLKRAQDTRRRRRKRRKK